MSTPNPITTSDPATLAKNESTLNTLSVLFYIWGSLMMLGGCFPALYLVIGTGLVATASPAAVLGGFFIFIGSFLILFILSMAVLVIYAGKCLANRERHLFCTIMACVICMNIPFGTTLGVITIIFIHKPEVKALFAGQQPLTQS